MYIFKVQGVLRQLLSMGFLKSSYIQCTQKLFFALPVIVTLNLVTKCPLLLEAVQLYTPWSLNTILRILSIDTFEPGVTSYDSIASGPLFSNILIRLSSTFTLLFDNEVAATVFSRLSSFHHVTTKSDWLDGAQRRSNCFGVSK